MGQNREPASAGFPSFQPGVPTPGVARPALRVPLFLCASVSLCEAYRSLWRRNSPSLLAWCQSISSCVTGLMRMSDASQAVSEKG